MSVSVAASVDTSAAAASAAAGPQLPPEIAKLGTPDEVFDLAAAKHSSQTILVVVVCLVLMVVCLAMGAPLVVCGIKPFGKSPPPLWACFGLGGPSLVLAMGLGYWAYYFAFESRAGLEAYHLFPDALAVLGPGGTRLIAWDRIGPQKPIGMMNPQHVFPVEGESDIRFTQVAAMEVALEMAITHRSTKARWTRLLTPAVVEQLSATGTSPAFLAHDPADRGLYRISCLGGRLLFARLSDGGATGTRGFEPASPPPNPGGFAGGYVAWKQAQHLEKLQAVIDRFDGIDDRQLFDLAAALPGSRLVAVEDVSAPELAAPTMWEKMSTGVHLVASLKFQGAEWGDKKLYLESRKQVGQAAEILRETLHADLRGAALGAVV